MTNTKTTSVCMSDYSTSKYKIQYTLHVDVLSGKRNK